MGFHRSPIRTQKQRRWWVTRFIMRHYQKHWVLYLVLVMCVLLGGGAQVLGPQLAETVAWAPMASMVQVFAKVVTGVSTVVFIVVALYLRHRWLSE